MMQRLPAKGFLCLVRLTRSKPVVQTLDFQPASAPGHHDSHFTDEKTQAQAPTQENILGPGLDSKREACALTSLCHVAWKPQMFNRCVQ